MTERRLHRASAEHRDAAPSAGRRAARRAAADARRREPVPACRAAMRARLARMGTRSQPGNPVLEPLFRAVRANHPKADLALLERAYRTAEQLHGTQMRKSGDPYITHPLAVTTILADIGMTEPTLVAALLHDTVEDTPYTLDQLRADFGDEVALLVDGVTKLDKVKYGDSAQAETIRKMIVAMARDIRVLVIKLADRLHNMRTLRYVKQATQERQATRDPRHLRAAGPPARHEHHQVGARGPRVRDPAPQDLRRDRADGRRARAVARPVPGRGDRPGRAGPASDAKIKATVTGRPKHYYSIYQKMIVGGREFTDIYDLVGIRILVEDDRDCYSVARRAALALEPGARAGSRTTSRCRSSTCTSRCTRR